MPRFFFFFFFVVVVLCILFLVVVVVVLLLFFVHTASVRPPHARYDQQALPHAYAAV